MDSLGDRIKGYEREYESEIAPYLPFIIRLDGKNFSKFTKGLKKPFDKNFTNAMVLTMNDLHIKFSPSTVYSHSDEITLIFPPVCSKEEFDSGDNKSVHPYNGRVLKLCTVTASYCGTRFANHIHNIIIQKSVDYDTKFIDKVSRFDTCFDARVIVPPFGREGDIVNHMIWRSIRDCKRNAIATYARWFFSNKEIFGKNSSDMIEMMKKEGFDFEKDAPLEFQHGVYGKKEMYEKEVELDGKSFLAVRQKVSNRLFRIYYSNEMLDLLLSKNWPPIAENFPIFTFDHN